MTDEGKERPETAKLRLDELPDSLVSVLRERIGALGDGELAVLPSKVDAGVGWYPSQHLYATKVLRSTGVSARFLHDSGEREFLHEHSKEVLLEFAIAVGSGLSFEGIKALLKYVRDQAIGGDPGPPDSQGSELPAKLRIARIEKDDLEIHDLEFDARNTDEVLEMLGGMLGVKREEEEEPAGPTEDP